MFFFLVLMLKIFIQLVYIDAYYKFMQTHNIIIILYETQNTLRIKVE